MGTVLSRNVTTPLLSLNDFDEHLRAQPLRMQRT